MRLAHFTDLHVLCLEGTSAPEFLNKRLVGGANLLLNRRKTHSRDLVDYALNTLQSLDWDHLAISGDVSNLALRSEFEKVREILDDFEPDAARLSIVPGNHDYYITSAVQAGDFERVYADYVRSDLPEYALATGYPFCRIRNGVALVGINSGIPTKPFKANGRVAIAELEALSRLLEDPRLDDLVRVVMIHHNLLKNPYRRNEESRLLFNRDDVLKVLQRGRVHLAIHGHNHGWEAREVLWEDGQGKMRICEPGSVSIAQWKAPERAGKFNIYDMEANSVARAHTFIFDRQSSFVPWRTVHFSDDAPPRIEEHSGE